MTCVFNYMLQYEQRWCSQMGYFNPYIDPFKNHLNHTMPFYDIECYNRYKKYNFVYDKLWVMKSQGLMAGRLEKLKGKEKNVKYPIFIKPRWGHLSATSKNCFKITSIEQLAKYIDYENMMWSEFIDATEGMTDFMMLNGRIVHQITYIYSDKQNGFCDVWKYISPETLPPPVIIEWTNKHMIGYSGILNVQYRDSKIIEVGLRFARGGAYVIATDNKHLIDNINLLYTKNEWNYDKKNEMKFKPYYSFKCYTTLPIVYIFPQKIIDRYMRKRTQRPFYEYYFEPTGSSGMVFFQFMEDDYKTGMKLKMDIERAFDTTQVVMYFLIGYFFVLLYVRGKYTVLIYIVLLIWLTRFLNPINSNFKIYKAQSQLFLGKDSMNESNETIETFDE